jgi:hypothetical protein
MPSTHGLVSRRRHLRFGNLTEIKASKFDDPERLRECSAGHCVNADHKKASQRRFNELTVNSFNFLGKLEISVDSTSINASNLSDSRS